ncbi:MAG: DsbA family protein [Bacteriovoracaceae bacterium]
MKILNLFVLISTLVFTSCLKEEQKAAKPAFIHKASSAPVTNTTAARVAGEEVSYQQLYSGVENDIFELEQKIYELKMSRLKAIMLEQFMNKHPGKKDLSNDQFLEKYISKNSKPSEKEIQKFIQDRGLPKESINDQMRTRIINFISMEQKKKDVDVWLTEQTQKYPVEIFFEKPSRPTFDVVVGEGPYYGNPNAKVTIVEFSDFQCPFCKKGKAVMEELKKKYGNKIKIVFKNFPLPFHVFAKKAAEASLCAHEQGQKHFWKMYDKMFNDQSKLSEKDLKSTAKSIGLDMKKFNNCLDSSKYAKTVDQDLEYGKKIGVKSTPTFFVNGQLINGAHPKKVFEDIIDPLLN